MAYQDSKGALSLRAATSSVSPLDDDYLSNNAFIYSLSIYQSEDYLSVVRTSPDYAKYTQSLRSAGYFRDEIEGSQKYKELEERAANYLVTSTRQRDEDAER